MEAFRGSARRNYIFESDLLLVFTSWLSLLSLPLKKTRKSSHKAWHAHVWTDFILWLPANRSKSEDNPLEREASLLIHNTFFPVFMQTSCSWRCVWTSEYLFTMILAPLAHISQYSYSSGLHFFKNDYQWTIVETTNRSLVIYQSNRQEVFSFPQIPKWF